MATITARLLLAALSLLAAASSPGICLPPPACQTKEADGAPPPDNGLLFAAFLFDRTPLAERWGQILPEAAARFPHLKLKAVADLHVTVVYVGSWDVEKLARLRRRLPPPIGAPIPLQPEIAYFGRDNRVVAVELQGVPAELSAAIVAFKQALSAEGLKRPESYDASFRAHVTIAEAGSPPGPAQVQELEAFRLWIAPRLDLPTLHVSLEPTMPLLWLLTEAPRPAPIPEYIAADEFLARRRSRD